MNFEFPESPVREALASACEKAWGLRPDNVPVTLPPHAEHGDFASPLCFELARTLRKAPKVIAEGIAEAFDGGGTIVRIEVAGAGYLNAFLDREAILRRWLVQAGESISTDDPSKRIVEHTNINPNKAAHIGHLRNAVLGDTLVRFLRTLGYPTEVQNYIDDTGVQVADLVVGFRVLRKEELPQVLERYSDDSLRARGERFDYIAWDLYAEVGRFYAEDKTRIELRADTLHAMEEGDNPIADLAAHIAHRMVQHHLATMYRLGVTYDVLPHESHILKLNFWADAFARLQTTGAIHQEEEGKNAGCWVMDLPGIDSGAGEDQKVIVRSNGTVTYVGKDIAYQMWKFGLLGRDFHYQSFDWTPSDELYPLQTTSASPGKEDAPGFGNATIVYNVIDCRQAYLQRVVKRALVSLGHEVQADRSIHFSYEMVALSPAAVQELFPDLELSEEERGKAYLEMSGRKGIGVKADDLLDTLQERARKEVCERDPEAADEVTEERARRIAVGALRYYMLRFSKNRVVAFDLDAALAFEGETGPYLQYAVLRARNILARVATTEGKDFVEAARLAEKLQFDALPTEMLADHWQLATLAARTPSILAQAIATLELSLAAKHAHLMAQTFNSFYHRYKVAAETDPEIKRIRTAFVRLLHDTLTELLSRMGIEIPDRM